MHCADAFRSAIAREPTSHGLSTMLLAWCSRVPSSPYALCAGIVVGVVALALLCCGPVCFIINGRARKKRETIAMVSTQ